MNNNEAINNFIFFTTNFPYNFIEKVFPNNKHLIDKFNNIAERSISSEIITKFYFQLDSTNREILLNWINKNYKA